MELYAFQKVLNHLISSGLNILSQQTDTNQFATCLQNIIHQFEKDKEDQKENLRDTRIY